MEDLPGYEAVLFDLDGVTRTATAHTAVRQCPLCAACAAEYADPAHRRFHAEPVADLRGRGRRPRPGRPAHR